MAGQDASQNSLVQQQFQQLTSEIQENDEKLEKARAALLDSNSTVDVSIRQQVYNDLVAKERGLMAQRDKLSAQLGTAMQPVHPPNHVPLGANTFRRDLEQGLEGVQKGMEDFIKSPEFEKILDTRVEARLQEIKEALGLRHVKAH